jgi:hypothetical protein
MMATLIQPGHTWIDVVLTVILMAPGIIAAVSSLRNGKKLDQSRRESRPEPFKADPAERPRKTGLPRDWFHP